MGGSGTGSWERAPEADPSPAANHSTMMSKSYGADTAHDGDSEMSTTDVSGDTANTDESDCDDQTATGSADAEAATVEAVVAAVNVADSIDQVEDVIDSFLAEAGTLSTDAVHRIELALQERTNDVYFAKLQQSLHASPVAVDLVVALRPFGPGGLG